MRVYGITPRQGEKQEKGGGGEGGRDNEGHLSEMELSFDRPCEKGKEKGGKGGEEIRGRILNIFQAIWGKKGEKRGGSRYRGAVFRHDCCSYILFSGRKKRKGGEKEKGKEGKDKHTISKTRFLHAPHKREKRKRRGEEERKKPRNPLRMAF